MPMYYVNNGPAKTKYFTDEDNAECIRLLTDWIPIRKEEMALGVLTTKIPDFVGVHVANICEQMSYRYNYRRHSYREEMVSEAMCNVFKYLHCFNPTLVGPRSGRINFYGWVTMCASRSFGNKIEEEHLQEYFKCAMFEEMGGMNALEDEFENGSTEYGLTTDIAQDMINKAREYEIKQRCKKDKAKQDDFSDIDPDEVQELPGLLKFFKKKDTE